MKIKEQEKPEKPLTLTLLKKFIDEENIKSKLRREESNRMVAYLFIALMFVVTGIAIIDLQSSTPSFLISVGEAMFIVGSMILGWHLKKYAKV